MGNLGAGAGVRRGARLEDELVHVAVIWGIVRQGEARPVGLVLIA